MSNEKKQAELAFKAMRKMLDGDNWQYTADEENKKIVLGVRGGDLPINIRIKVDEERSLLRIYSYVNSVPESKRLEAAVAICAINYRLVSGCFDYDFRDGEVSYRQTISYEDSVLSESMCRYLLLCACQTVDEYNDKLASYIAGGMTIEELIDAVNR